MAVVTAPGSLLGRAARTRAAGQFAKRVKRAATSLRSIADPGHALTCVALGLFNAAAFTQDWHWAVAGVTALVLDWKIQG